LCFSSWKSCLCVSLQRNRLLTTLVQKHIIDCPCKDPLVPIKDEFDDWDLTFQQNKEIAASSRARNARVVFYGDSITEGWRGTSFGKERPRTEGVSVVFDSMFSTDTGAIFDGVALGLAGDKVR
jgi:hypothetical protein